MFMLMTGKIYFDSRKNIRYVLFSRGAFYTRYLQRQNMYVYNCWLESISSIQYTIMMH